MPTDNVSKKRGKAKVKISDKREAAMQKVMNSYSEDFDVKMSVIQELIPLTYAACAYGGPLVMAASQVTVDALFRARARPHPARVALQHGTQRLSYAELDGRVDRLAALLARLDRPARRPATQRASALAPAASLP